MKFNQQFVLSLIEYMVVGFCHRMHPPVYLAALLNILDEEHPEPIARVIGESAFLPCDDLPPLLDLDITADYVECLAHQFQGFAGPCGSTALQCHGYLLGYGVPSAHLHNAVVTLAHHLANKLWILCVYVL